MRNFDRDRGPRRSSFGDRDRDRVRVMYKAVCSNCGKDCEVPFKPTGSKPVLCSECFSKENGGDRDRGPRRFGGDRDNDRGPRRPSFRDRDDGPSATSAQLSALNAKLDKIIALLGAKETQAQVTEPVKETPVKKSKVKIPPIGEETSSEE